MNITTSYIRIVLSFLQVLPFFPYQISNSWHFSYLSNLGVPKVEPFIKWNASILTRRLKHLAGASAAFAVRADLLGTYNCTFSAPPFQCFCLFFCFMNKEKLLSLCEILSNKWLKQNNCECLVVAVCARWFHVPLVAAKWGEKKRVQSFASRLTFISPPHPEHSEAKLSHSLRRLFELSLSPRSRSC